MTNEYLELMLLIKFLRGKFHSDIRKWEIRLVVVNNSAVINRC